MVRNSAYEAQSGVLGVPLSRMYLMPTGLSTQHPSLTSLEQQLAPSGHLVLYAAPAFYLQQELNEAFLGGDVIDRSWFFRPSAIGALPDDYEHSVSFNAAQGAYRFSEPVGVNRSLVREEISTRLKAPTLLSRVELGNVTEKMLKIIRERHSGDVIPDDRLRSRLTPLVQIAYLSRAFFDASLLVVRAASPA